MALQISPVSSTARTGGVPSQDTLGLEPGSSTHETRHPRTHTPTLHLDTQGLLPRTSLPTPLTCHIPLSLTLITRSPHPAFLLTLPLLFLLQLSSTRHSPLLSGLRTRSRMPTSLLLPLRRLFLPHRLINTHASPSASSRSGDFWLAVHS